MKESEAGGFDFIATHVDDLIVASKNPQECIAKIEQECALRNTEIDLSHHLGSKLKRRPDGKLQMNMEDHIKESIRTHETKHDLT